MTDEVRRFPNLDACRQRLWCRQPAWKTTSAKSALLLPAGDFISAGKSTVSQPGAGIARLARAVS